MNAEPSSRAFCIFQMLFPILTIADTSYRIKILCDCLDILQYNVLYFKKRQMIFFEMNWNNASQYHVEWGPLSSLFFLSFGFDIIVKLCSNDWSYYKASGFFYFRAIVKSTVFSLIQSEVPTSLLFPARVPRTSLSQQDSDNWLQY